MPNSSRRKGFDFEREVVLAANVSGVPAKRAWGSDGSSLGLQPETDLVLAGRPFQAKRRARLPKDFKVPMGIHGCIIREDRGETYVLMPLECLFKLLKQADFSP